jgi:hypothetical protein
MQVSLSEITRGVYNWFEGFTKEVLKKFPDAIYGYSEEEKAWQILTADNRLIISIGFLSEKREFIYLYSAGSGMKNGRTRDLKDLLDIIKFLEV